jgi:hypothetical protein
VGYGEVKRTLGDAHALGRHVVACLVEEIHELAEAFAFLSHEILLGGHHIRQAYFGGV